MRNYKDSDNTAYKILGFGVMICAIFMFLLAILIDFPGKGNILEYNYATVKDPTVIAIALYAVGAPLFILGAVTVIFKINKKPMAYIIISYALIAMMGVCVCTQFDFMLIFVLPPLAAQLFIDKKLTKFSELGTILCFILAVIFTAFIFKSYPTWPDEGLNLRFVAKLLKILVPNIAILFIFAIIFNKLSDKTTNMQLVNMEQTKTIDNRADVMNSLIKSSLDLFTATKIVDLDDAIRTTCIDVCSNFLETPLDPLKVYIGKSFDGTFKCYGAKNENGTYEMIPAIKTQYSLDIQVPCAVENAKPGESNSKELNLPLYYEKEIINEYNENGELVFDNTVEKQKYKKEKEKNVFVHTFEREMHDTIISVYTKDNVTKQMKLIYFVIIDAKLTMNETLDEIIKIMTNNIGVALINITLNEDFLKSQREMIKTLAVVTDRTSKHTANHVQRVSEYMRILCADPFWGFTEKKIERISVASMMHDVGKIYIDKSILEKNAGLTEAEYEEIKKHVDYGTDLIKDCPGDIMRYAKVMIQDHHERWDGKGYKKKRGTQIDLLGRIIAIADVFDALMSPRPYKPAWPAEKVYNTICNDINHFDPNVIAVFKKHFTELVKVYNDNKDPVEVINSYKDKA
ncbi:MAG: HD domain-containing protein [Acholeplasmatales bacterium]|nr:HD domain-containing protein [Acholeplasmatales bacterium]